MKTLKAFTLIELLVVVAIIGILAAIAAPNYQMAMNRSKVARFMADGRAAETGIETYYVDYGKYPNADRYSVGSTCGDYDSNPDTAGGGYLPRSLTTPSAYLSKLPIDTFRIEEAEKSCDPFRKTFLYSNDMQNTLLYGSSQSGNYSSWCYALLMGYKTFTSQRPSNAYWMINSPGPDGDRDHGQASYSSGATPSGGNPVQYDPTNGSISNGDLFMFGPGLGFGQQQ